jgi:RHS repeat-associated protein
VVVSDTEAVYLYGLDIIAQQQAERLYYFHDGLGSVRQMLDSTGEVETNYAYDPFGVPVVAGDASNPYQFTGEAWDEEVELLYLRARYYQPETGRFITKDPWAGDVSQPGTLNPWAYVGNNAVRYSDPSGLNGSEPVYDPQFGGSYIPLEARVRMTRAPGYLSFRGGAEWLQTAVERDPLVNRVYIALRLMPERQLDRQRPLGERAREPADPMAFLCEAIRAARLDVSQYAPTLCTSLDSPACSRLTVRMALNAAAAAVQHAAGISPRIQFELEKEREEFRRGKLRLYALPDIKTRPFDSLGWYSGQEEYVVQQDSWWDKSYHFFTHAFMTYELRWRGITPPLAQTITDWQGRAYEVSAEAMAALRDPDNPNPYSRNDVVANRWGAAFGSAFFDNPGRLVRECYRTSIKGCLVYQADNTPCY